MKNEEKDNKVELLNYNIFEIKTNSQTKFEFALHSHYNYTATNRAKMKKKDCGNS